MTTYKVASDNTTLGSIGAVVNAKDLEGLNVDALLQGGHLTEVKNAKSENQSSKDEI